MRISDWSSDVCSSDLMMALLIARGEMKADEEIISEGITGSLFSGRMVDRTKVGSFDAFIPEISGTAYLTGLHQFLIDPEDPQQIGRASCRERVCQYV